MPLPVFRVALLSLVLVGRTVLAEQPPVAFRHLRLELKAASWVQAQTVPVAPGQTTVFLFDSELQREGVEWEGRERFAVVEVGERSITLIAAATLTEDAPVRLTVRFRDGAIPESAVFLLVGQSRGAAHLVEVHRYPRTAESYQQEAEQERERALRCEEENARLRATQGGLEALTALLASGDMDTKGVRALDLQGAYTQPSDEVLKALKVFTQRSFTRVLLAVRLQHTGEDTPWAAESILLVGEGGEVLEASLWQRAPIAPGGMEWVYIELEADEEEARGTYTLSLREATGARVVHVANIRFPS